MLGYISVNLRLGSLRVWNQRLLRISRSQHTSLLQHDLQLHTALPINARGGSLARAQQHLTQLLPYVFHLLFGNLLPGHHRIARLRVLQELREEFFLAWLFKKRLDLLIRSSASARSCGFRLIVVLRDHNRTHQIELAFNLGAIGYAFRPGFFSDRQQFAHVLREVFAS